jgi:serine/threonine protein kinase
MVGRREEVENLAREIQLMRGLAHPNIVEYIGATVDERQGHVYIFQEWVPGETSAVHCSQPSMTH